MKRVKCASPNTYHSIFYPPLNDNLMAFLSSKDAAHFEQTHSCSDKSYSKSIRPFKHSGSFFKYLHQLPPLVLIKSLLQYKKISIDKFILDKKICLRNERLGDIRFFLFLNKCIEEERHLGITSIDASGNNLTLCPLSLLNQFKHANSIDLNGNSFTSSPSFNALKASNIQYSVNFRY